MRPRGIGKRRWHAIPGRTGALCLLYARRISIAGHRARRAGRCGGTSLSFAHGKKRRSKDTGHACAAARTKLQRSEERRVGKSVDLGGRRIIKKKKKRKAVPASRTAKRQ